MNSDLFLSFGSKSETGKEKEFNSDAIIDFKILNGHVFAVCDGHDGAEGYGALAANIVTDSIRKYFYNRSYKDIAKALTNAVVFANFSLYEQSQKDPKYKGIGSTLAILIWCEKNIYYAYAGDSRIYLWRKGEIQLLTRDHVENPENAAGTDVTILLGRNKDIKFGVCKSPLIAEEHDVFLLCTDGLSDVVSKAELVELLSDPNTSPEHKSLQLSESVDEAGGVDNYSLQVVEFSKPIVLIKNPKKVDSKPMLLGLVIVIISVILVFAAFIFVPQIKSSIVGWSSKNATQSQSVKNKKGEHEISISPIKDEKKTKTNESATLQPKVKPAEIKKEMANNTTTSIHEHVIQYGENLYRLSLRYNTTQQAIIDLNGEVAKKLIAGKKLKIPVKALHKIQSGESLSTLSDTYNVKIKLICEANRIEANKPLTEGKILVIPKP